MQRPWPTNERPRARRLGEPSRVANVARSAPAARRAPGEASPIARGGLCPGRELDLRWIREGITHWDEHKHRIIGRAQPGVFDDRYRRLTVHELLPGEWWRVEDAAGRVVGYGWLEVAWDDADALLAVDPSLERRGVGSFILERLEAEAQGRGLRHVTNLVRPTHPRREAVTRFLRARGFVPQSDGRLAKQVG